MGYYVNLQEANFAIGAENIEEATRLLKALNHDPNARKGGGSWRGGQLVSRHFSWMSANYDEELDSAVEIFEALGFEVHTDETGSLELMYYDSKIGDEAQFVNAVAHLANEDWFLVWRGEDGAIWRDSALGTQNGTVVFL